MNPIKGLGEYLLAVRSAELNPGRKLEWRGVGGAKGASEAVPSDGGFLVPEEFRSEVIERIYLDEVIGRCLSLPMKTSSLSFPQFDESSRVNGSRFGGVASYWVNEADPATKSKPKFLKSTLTAHKIIGLCYVTDELLADADALGVFAATALVQELRFRLTDAIVNGDGSGKPWGILASAALITMAKAAGQASATVVGQNVTDLYRSMWAPCRRNAVWLCHPDAEAQLIGLTVTVGSAGSELKLYHPTPDPVNQPYNTMLGRPVIPIEQCQALGTPGDLILADLSRYLLGLRSIEQAASMEVNFVTDETAFRITLRVDGQPLDPRPITPFTGTNPVSSFVAIAQR